MFGHVLFCRRCMGLSGKYYLVRQSTREIEPKVICNTLQHFGSLGCISHTKRRTSLFDVVEAREEGVVENRGGLPLDPLDRLVRRRRGGGREDAVKVGREGAVP